jgi:hypothetical protein
MGIRCVERFLFTLGFVFLVGCGVESADLTVSSTSSSAGEGTAQNLRVSESCRFLGDKYEPKAVLQGGRHKGECADTTSARTVVWNLDNFPLDTETLIVANVSHGGRFWIAEFPRYGVEDVIFQMEKFPAIVPAAHTQIRIRFKDDAPVKMTDQLDPARQIYLNDFVLSVEALGQKGWKFDLLLGMKDEYLTTYRITSLSDKYNWMVVKQKHEVIQWPLNISELDKAKIIPAFLSIANKEGMTKNYHTLFRNCTNELFRAMDSTFNYGWLNVLPIKISKIDETYPVLVKGALDARKLIKYVDNPQSYPANRPRDKTVKVPDRFEVRLPNLEVDPTVRIVP